MRECRLTAISVFFKKSGAPRVLPFSPTRRASVRRARARTRLGDIPGARADLRAALAAQRGPDRARLLGRLAMLRSEEHTSELQSRQYLVCRLLLEKKKR